MGRVEQSRSRDDMVSHQPSPPITPSPHHPITLQRLRRSEFATAMLFISPWIVGFCWFQLYPILASLYYSLTYYNMMQPPIYVGFDNFSRLFGQDDLFWK